MLLQLRTISDRKPDLRRVRPAKAVKFGPAFSSSHSKQSFRAQAGAGPLFGSLRSFMQIAPHA